ncbi:MAG TPA: SusC/RagA family TonB-linked outer membrane protein [Lutibacter sp.]|nr:SusC/RagA family TonB-linked outer membrane protein [Lutibacter sp.]
MKQKFKLSVFVSILFFTVLSFAQEKQISGTVTSTGSPIPGVNVIVQGTSNGVQTDFDGNYTINASSGDVLSFSFMGLITQNITIGSSNTINVVLEEDSQMLDEVIVTALGIKREQKALGYSVTQVSGDDLKKTNTTSAINSLQGKVAGVNISTNSTGASGSSRVVIRGASSLTGNNQPLYVIDGIPIINATHGSVAGPFGGEHGDGGDDISSLNPNDIKTISVLKGSSASALYGSLASNGVIMITTKSGKGNNKLGIEFNSNITFNKVNTSLLDLQDTYGQGKYGLKPGFQYDVNGDVEEITDEALATSDALEEAYSSWGEAFDGSDVINWDGKKRPYSYLGSNIDKFYNTGTTINNSIALSKGGDNYNYRFSFSNLDNDDIFPNTTLNRNTISLNASANINPKLVSSVNATYSIDKVHNRVTIGDTPGNANTVAWLLPGNVDIYGLKPGSNENGTELLNDTSQFITNPYWATNNYNNDDQKNRLFASATMKYDVTDWLYVLGRSGIDTYSLDKKQVTPYGTEFRPTGVLTQSVVNNSMMNSDLMLGIDKNLTKTIATKTILGGSTRYEIFKGLSARGTNFIVPEVEDLNLTTLPEPRNIFREKKTNSLYGSVETDFNQTYFLTLTGRNDWFSTLSYLDKTTTNNEFYWSLSGSMLLDKVFEMSEKVNFLKLRGSYAQVAGGADQAYLLNQNYSILGSFQGQPYGTINGSLIPNANLVPLEKEEFEIGIDARLFSNRLFIDASYYSNRTSKDIVYASAAESSGYTSAILNVGELSNKGVELLIGGSPIKKDDFSWETSFNIGYNNSEILSTDEVDTPINVDGSMTRSKNAIISHMVGEHYGVIYGTTYVRDTINGTNRILYDTSGDVPIPIQGENKVIGQGVAPLNLGFKNTISYKAFSLGFLIDGKFGGDVHSGTNLSLIGSGLHKKTLEGRENGLAVSGVFQSGVDGNGDPIFENFETTVAPKDLQKYYGGIGAENTGIAEEFIYSTDFFKLRSLSLTYNFSKTLINKISISDLSFSLIGRDLFYLYKKTENIDPESSLNNMNSQGIERFGLPSTRSLGFSINIKL